MGAEVTDHWARADWFTASSGITSIAGFAISIWVAFQLRRIKIAYMARIRLVQILDDCENSLTFVNELAGAGTADDITRARIEIEQVRAHLEEAERYLPFNERRRLRKKNKNIGKQVDNVREIMDRYSECRQVMILIESKIQEQNWR